MVKYPLANTAWDKEEYSAIKSVIDSDRFTMGDNVMNFENAFADYIGSKYCVMVNSGSSANLLAVAALFYCANNQLSRGDEVIVPAVSWSTTYYPLHQYGLKLKFVDIDINTLNYDLDSLKNAVSDSTRLIVVVNLLGNPNDFQALNDIVADKNIVMIEDNCESMGAKYKNRFTGTFGKLGTFSTFFSHHISTMEGGMIVTDDDELYQILLSLRSHGWTRNLPKNNLICGKLDNDPFYESFNFVLPGYNVRPLEMSGAIGLKQLEKLPNLIEERRKNFSFFEELFAHHPHFSIQKEIGESSWFGFALILKKDSPASRTEFVKLLSKNGIECRPIVAGNFTKNPVIKWFNYEIHETLTNANIINDAGFFVGNHHYDISEQLLHLNKTLYEVC